MSSVVGLTLDRVINKVELAKYFAIAAHDAIGQIRKYTGEPYWVHPQAVAKIVSNAGGDEDMVAAAWLHDAVEDTQVSIDTITSLFGERVSTLVAGLTDVSILEQGNRAARKKIDRMHTSEQSPDCKTIKLADLIDNTHSIMEHDRNFARVYIMEKELLLDEALLEGDPVLWEIAKILVDKAKKELFSRET